jgi:glycine/D-amino acid oxidase-like deaminating enzyme
VAVVGAGAFGGWTALQLLRLGARVTLIDAWGPGNSRASSGGETRVIRGMYGAGELYTRWVVRALELWRETARHTGLDLYHQTGALWMFRGDDAYARSSRPILEAAGLPLERLEEVEARRRFPQIDFQGVRSVWFEPEAGYLTARRACQAVARLVEAEGGEIRRAAAMPGLVRSGRMASVRLLGGAGLAADAFVFACGPWLGGLFPEVIGERIRPTRQEVFFFGPPVVNARFAEGSFPVWVDFGERIFYGIPGNEHRGFKVADDTHGERIDPTTLERRPDEAALERARGLLRERFPALADAPLLEARVCQYENTRDGHFVIDRHPDAANAWLVGGGSGHGFKLGPAVGERVAAQVLGREEPLPELSLERLDRLEGPERSQLETGEGP